MGSQINSSTSNTVSLTASDFLNSSIIPDNIDVFRKSDSILEGLNASHFNISEIKESSELYLTIDMFEENKFLQKYTNLYMFVKTSQIKYNNMSIINKRNILEDILITSNLLQKNSNLINTTSLLTIFPNLEKDVDFINIIKEEHSSIKESNQGTKIPNNKKQIITTYYLELNKIKESNLIELSYMMANEFFQNTEIVETVSREYYTEELDHKNFFISSFRDYIQHRPNSAFCSDGFGSNFRNLLQRKATTTTRELIEEDLNLYFDEFVAYFPMIIELADITFSEDYIIGSTNKKLIAKIIVFIKSNVNDEFEPLIFSSFQQS